MPRRYLREQSVVATASQGVLIERIEPVLTGTVTSVLGAPSASRVLIVQALRSDDTPDSYGEEKLWLYDTRRKRLTLLYRVHDDPERKRLRHILPLAWFADSKSALCKLWEHRQGDSDRTTALFVNTERVLVRAIDSVAYFNDATPTAQDELLLFAGTAPGLLRMDQPRVVYTLSSTGQVRGGTLLTAAQAGAREKAARPPAPVPLWRLHHEQIMLPPAGAPAAFTGVLWLEAHTPRPDGRFARGLVTAETDDLSVVGAHTIATLLPDQSAILFTRDQVLYMASLTPLAAPALAEAEYRFDDHNARDIAAVLGQGQNAPTSQQEANEMLLRTLSDSRALQHFVFAPTRVLFGYVQFPRGRILLYRDGHTELQRA